MRVEIHADGSCKGNGREGGGQGGWAAILTCGGHRKTLTGSELGSTNNRMELMGVIGGLEALLIANSPVDIYTDSKYVRNGITKWIKGWKKNGWKAYAGHPVKNKDLWERLDAVNSKHQVVWHWERGHADNEINNLVDELAQAAAVGK